MESTKPRVLVVGSTGLIGKAIAADLDDASDRVEVVRASRDPEVVERWRVEGRSAVRLDLDDARTFAAALDGIDRLFLMTGYTVAMTHQTKTITDAAVNAGVGRFVAQPGGIQYLDDYYRPHGTLSIPLLTLHTTMDPDVPFFHEAALAKTVAAARSSKWRAQQSVQRYGHCNVTPAEVILTLGRLVNWTEHGISYRLESANRSVLELVVLADSLR